MLASAFSRTLRAERMQTRHWIIVASILGLLVVGGGICICGVLGFLVSSAPDEQISDERQQREGMAAGASGTTEGCIVLAHDRTVQCGAMNIPCTLDAQDFARACFRAVPTPQPGICDGVPAPTALGDWDFADHLCQVRGWSSDLGECDPVAEALSVYCYGE